MVKPEQINRAVRNALKQVAKWQSPPNWSHGDWRDETSAVAYLAALQASREFVPDRGVPFEAFATRWILSAVLTHFRNEWRYSTRHQATEDADVDSPRAEWDFPDPQAERFVNEICNREALQQAMASLSIREREVLHRIFWLEQTERETAKALGLSLYALHTHKHRALSKLRRALQGEETAGARSHPQQRLRPLVVLSVKAAVVLFILFLVATVAMTLAKNCGSLTEYLASMDRNIMQHMQYRDNLQEAQKWRQNVAHDPAIGKQMPLPTKDVRNRPLAFGQPGVMQYRFVFVKGNIHPYNYTPLVRWLRSKASSSDLVVWIVVSSGTKAGALKLQQDLHFPNVQVVWDAKGKLHKEWNAFFYARMYTTDATGKLLHIAYHVERGVLQ